MITREELGECSLALRTLKLLLLCWFSRVEGMDGWRNVNGEAFFDPLANNEPTTIFMFVFSNKKYLSHFSYSRPTTYWVQLCLWHARSPPLQLPHLPPPDDDLYFWEMCTVKVKCLFLSSGTIQCTNRLLSHVVFQPRLSFFARCRPCPPLVFIVETACDLFLSATCFSLTSTLAVIIDSSPGKESFEL